MLLNRLINLPRPWPKCFLVPYRTPALTTWNMRITRNRDCDWDGLGTSASALLLGLELEVSSYEATPRLVRLCDFELHSQVSGGLGITRNRRRRSQPLRALQQRRGSPSARAAAYPIHAYSCKLSLPSCKLHRHIAVAWKSPEAPRASPVQLPGPHQALRPEGKGRKAKSHCYKSQAKQQSSKAKPAQQLSQL